MTESTAEVLTVAEAAHLLRLSRNSTYAAVKRGELPAVRVGRRLLIPREALERFLSGARTYIAQADGFQAGQGLALGTSTAPTPQACP